MKILKIALGSLLIIGAISAFVFASVSENVSGWAWSSNVGWLQLNNCSDPSDAGTCVGQDFGVNFDQSTGVGSGYAWSSNIGWISFDNKVCPTDFSNCELPHIQWLADGAGLMRGFVRACSVYEIGCSGVLKNNSLRGGWDGFINLGDGSTDWGVKISPTGLISGFAWGSEVVGWVDFAGQGDTKIILPPSSCDLPKIINPTNNDACELPPDCLETQVFDVSIWQCVDILPPPEQGCPIGQSWNGTQCINGGLGGGGTGGGGTGGGSGGDSSCSAPFVKDSAGTCVACGTGKVYDSTSKSCVNKPKPGFKEF